MKISRLILIFSLSIGFLIIATFFACQKEELREVTIIRDCSGTYIRWNNKDYHVCNYEKIADYADNLVLTVDFYKISSCNDTSAVCELYHQNEGPVFIKKIK
jgi:hypothetical protein